MPDGNRNVKDTVFRAMFRSKEYVLELYRALCPEDTTATVDDLEIITLENVLAVREYNDLGFLVRDKLMILVEAQSTWSDNIIVRLLLYWLIELQQYIERTEQDLFSSRMVRIPMPELFVIYTGERRDMPAAISLNEKLFAGEWSGDIPINIICGGRGNDLIAQYVKFSKMITEEARRTPNDLLGATERTIKRCRDEGVLVSFLSDHEAEVHNTMQLFTEEFMKRAMLKTAYREGLDVGLEVKQREVLEGLFGLVNDGTISVDVASTIAKLPVPDFQQRMTEHYSTHR